MMRTEGDGLGGGGLFGNGSLSTLKCITIGDKRDHLPKIDPFSLSHQEVLLVFSNLCNHSGISWRKFHSPEAYCGQGLIHKVLIFRPHKSSEDMDEHVSRNSNIEVTTSHPMRYVFLILVRGQGHLWPTTWY